MAFLNWLRLRPRDERAAPDPVEEEPTSVLPARRKAARELDAIEAIEAHMRWKARLELRLFGKPGGALPAERIFRDKESTLGRWLYGPGSARFGTQELFVDLKRHHAEFHRHAGQAALAFNAGRQDEAIRMVTGGEYVRASSRIRQTLARLFAEAEERGETD